MLWRVADDTRSVKGDGREGLRVCPPDVTTNIISCSHFYFKFREQRRDGTKACFGGAHMPPFIGMPFYFSLHNFCPQKHSNGERYERKRI